MHVHLEQDLRLAVGRLARNLRRVLAENADGLTILEMGVLQRLTTSGPQSPGYLAGLEGVTPAAIAETLTRLESLRFIDRTLDPKDGRRVVVTITTTGSESMELRSSAVLRRMSEVLRDRLNENERSRLARAIPILEKVASEL